VWRGTREGVWRGVEAAAASRGDRTIVEHMCPSTCGEVRRASVESRVAVLKKRRGQSLGTSHKLTGKTVAAETSQLAPLRTGPGARRHAILSPTQPGGTAPARRNEPRTWLRTCVQFALHHISAQRAAAPAVACAAPGGRQAAAIYCPAAGATDSASRPTARQLRRQPADPPACST
jgi:hypothetical protein